LPGASITKLFDVISIDESVLKTQATYACPKIWRHLGPPAANGNSSQFSMLALFCGQVNTSVAWNSATANSPVRISLQSDTYLCPLIAWSFCSATIFSMNEHAFSSDIRRYALAGAQVRLTEMVQEVEAIRRAFPELRESRGPRRREDVAEQESDGDSGTPARGRRRRSTMSAAQRKAVGERMKKYWAAKRNGSLGSSASESPETPAPAGASSAAKAGGTATRRLRTMSPAARKRISDAQKARWAAHRGGAQATGASASEAGTSGARKAPSAKGRPRAAKRGPRKVSATARKRMSQAQKKRWTAKRKAA
jgi:hypothetical protein